METRFLFAPVKPFQITQYFGENKVCTDKATGTKYVPCNGHKPPKGWKSVYSRMKGHNGIDLRTKAGQPVYAAQDGIVVEKQTEIERGLGLGFVTDKKFYCTETKKKEHFKWREWHFLALKVELGQKVRVGQLIGYSDSTGISTGHHDHFELKPVKKSGKKWINILQTNGYFGAVDPLPYMFTHIFARDANLLRSVFERLARIADKLGDALRR